MFYETESLKTETKLRLLSISVRCYYKILGTIDPSSDQHIEKCNFEDEIAIVWTNYLGSPLNIVQQRICRLADLGSSTDTF